jgi:hypothetical protein
VGKTSKEKIQIEHDAVAPEVPFCSSFCKETSDFFVADYHSCCGGENVTKVTKEFFQFSGKIKPYF